MPYCKFISSSRRRVSGLVMLVICFSGYRRASLKAGRLKPTAGAMSGICQHSSVALLAM